MRKGWKGNGGAGIGVGGGGAVCREDPSGTVGRSLVCILRVITKALKVLKQGHDVIQPVFLKD